MRAVGIKGGKGSADDLFIEEGVSDPVASGDAVLVKIRAFGLNRMDIMQRNGGYPVPPAGGKILGVEFSGTVEATGPECTVIPFDHTRSDQPFAGNLLSPDQANKALKLAKRSSDWHTAAP
jgi:NADPH:quinone reductase-like Zn-dependent oxidoreductase